MERKNIAYRCDFDDSMSLEIKTEIAEKFHMTCAHCGKHIELKAYGGQGTIDHFIPLSKGGVNQKINYVYLCEDCNKKKNNKIIAPSAYIRYMDPDDMKKLSKYFQDYIDSFEYCSRGNIFACDMYKVIVPVPAFWNKERTRHMKNVPESRYMKPYYIVRAEEEDLEEITDYYIQYLKKYKIFDNEETAAANIEFWYRFGVIYVMRNSDHSIRVMTPIVISQRTAEDGALKVTSYLFSLRSDKMTNGIVSCLPDFIARRLVEERNLDSLEEKACIPPEDPSSAWLVNFGYSPAPPKQIMFRQAYSRYSNKMEDRGRKRPVEHLAENIEEDLSEFFRDHDVKKLSWMAKDIAPEYANELEQGQKLQEESGQEALR